MANIFVRSSYVLAILFAILVAVSGNRLYPKPQLNGEQVGHYILQSALSLKGGSLHGTCSYYQYVYYCSDCDKQCKQNNSNWWGQCSAWPIRDCYCYWNC
ncbi:hypothetical protein Bca4012_005207 [Brassica carinata]|uniref:Uncharacterized protein n=2 Tax=Brassica cretica TaxID=69181 RepID=A0ABQ7C5L9_BRACR|nr:hypothetical protein F2Q68_00003736 [Brassica cretica]KAF3546613.1 hypothetical protein DY000_02005502 [Brassica cretica]